VAARRNTNHLAGIAPCDGGTCTAGKVESDLSDLLQISQLLAAGYLGLDWSSATHTVIAGDFDGDHHKELLLLGVKPATAGALVHRDAGGRLVAVMQSFTDGFLGRHWNAQDEALYVGDFNGDGREDLLVQSRRAIAGESAYALLLADGDGRFTRIDKDAALRELAAALTAPPTADDEDRKRLSREVFPVVKRFYDGWLDEGARVPFYRPSSRR